MLAPSCRAKATNSWRSDMLERSCHGIRAPSFRGGSMPYQVLPMSPNGCYPCPRSAQERGISSGCHDRWRAVRDSSCVGMTCLMHGALGNDRVFLADLGDEGIVGVD